MKIIFTISLLFITLLSGFAQQNKIVVENKIWSVVQENCLPEGNFYTTVYHRFGDDTLIDGRQYKKVMISEDELYQEWFFNGYFVREESEKVYLREYLGNEGLIYDFNLLPGDTITINNPLAPDGLLLSLAAIDSVETADGYRMRWRLEKDEFSPPEYWIEGIGSLSGVLNSGTGVFGPLCGAFTLLCEKENDVTIYQNPEYETCYYVLLGINDGVQDDIFSFEIRQSQRQEGLVLFFNDDKPKIIQITSLSGNNILKSHTNKQEIHISRSVLSKGLYVITAFQNNKMHSQKVIVF